MAHKRNGLAARLRRRETALQRQDDYDELDPEQRGERLAARGAPITSNEFLSGRAVRPRG